jgi:hypothetical protein
MAMEFAKTALPPSADDSCLVRNDLAGVFLSIHANIGVDNTEGEA